MKKEVELVQFWMSKIKQDSPLSQTHVRAEMESSHGRNSYKSR